MYTHTQENALLMQLQRMWDLIWWEAYEQFTMGHAAKGLESHTEWEKKSLKKEVRKKGDGGP